jgi:FAD:protein FMN transferase
MAATAAASAGADLRETSASWRAIGTSVHLIVTDPDALGPACRMLRADLAAVDAACSRFRPDSEIVALDRGRGGRAGPVRCGSARSWPRRLAWPCARPD